MIPDVRSLTLGLQSRGRYTQTEADWLGGTKAQASHIVSSASTLENFLKIIHIDEFGVGYIIRPRNGEKARYDTVGYHRFA